MEIKLYSIKVDEFTKNTILEALKQAADNATSQEAKENYLQTYGDMKEAFMYWSETTYIVNQ